jgi:alpha-L-fucosidase
MKVLCVFLLAAMLCAGAAPGEQEATAAALKAFDEMKFGMFIHWGLYAIPAGEWKGKYVRGIGEWIMFREKIPVAEYEQLARQFRPVKFNADEWSQVAKDAGMKYMVITSKHHDGFAMYGSKASKYNIVDATPWRRDPMKELAAANEKRGIDFGFYYSQDQDWHEANGRGNNWDFPQERNAQIYLENKVFPQVKEILSGYGKLRLIWFDTPGLLSEKQVTDLREMVKTLQPDCLINSRIGHGKHDYMQTGDNAIPIDVYQQDGKWEVPATLNDTWGFKTNDTNWKQPRDLIAKLIDIVSKGGNYLLNVGPTAEGVMPKASQDILRTIGKWLEVNGEAIYGAGPSPIRTQGITWRATTKPGKLYILFVNWPGQKFRLEGLQSEVKKATWLAGGKEIPFKRVGRAIEFDLPAMSVGSFSSVMALELAGEKPKVAAGYRVGDQPERLDLYAWVSRLRGEEVRYDWRTKSASGFKEQQQDRNSLAWYPYKSLDGEYEVEITYACDDAAAGSKFKLSSDVRGQPALSAIEGTVEATAGKFVTKRIEGKLAVKPAVETVSFQLTGDDKSAAMKVQKITLVSAKAAR